jgi:NTE family protein
MKKWIFMLWLLTGFSLCLSAQKIGLVLSGGGAKGITHIGVIKALEEHNIPIDYVAGTSMGAVVGGMYAMGFSPDEMIEILKSKDFKYWSTGELESDFIYYYLNSDPKPGFLEFRFQLDKLDSLRLKPNFLPTNFVSPRQMNFAFVPLFSQANAVSGGDFDQLFVPFRCVASDIYKKEAVVFRKGVLGDAIRASMTFPFVFKPIVIDDRLLFDGGIFNNFPVDVMRNDFNPDIMIGSVVSNNPSKPDERDLGAQIQNMIMTRTDYTIPEEEGFLLKFDLDNVNLFDFSKVDELVALGYDAVLRQLNDINSRVNRQMPKEEIEKKRSNFRQKFPELKFQKVNIEGVNNLQKQYVEQIFHANNEVFDLNEFKESYFKLISDEKISEVIPHAQYNHQTGYFDLSLDVKAEDQLKLMLGGNVSSSTSNQAYFGLTYQNLNEYAQTAYVDAQFGRMYNGLGLGTRIEIPKQKSGYVKLALVFHKFDYFEGNRLFYEDNRSAYFNQYEGYSKLSFGYPLTMKGRIEFGLGFGALTDNYTQNRTLLSPNQKNDKSTFLLGSLFGKIESYTLNNVMYPTKGSNYVTSLQIIGGEENFTSGSSSTLNQSGKIDLWIQYKAKIDRYIPLSPQLTLGAYGELMFSTRKLLNNYTVTVIQAPAFSPTPHSRTIFNEAFTANQFAAIGLKPIYSITDQLYVRGEAYWFVPYQTLMRRPDNSATYSKPFFSTQFMSEASLVFNFRIASAGMFVNYYSSAVSQWNFGVNIGFLLFNNKFTE